MHSKYFINSYGFVPIEYRNIPTHSVLFNWRNLPQDQDSLISTQTEREVNKIPEQNLIEKAIDDVLCTLRPNEDITIDSNKVRPLMIAFAELLDKILITPATTTSVDITVPAPGEPLTRRCGLNCKDIKDLNHLFLRNIHTPLQECYEGGNKISSFYVKRS